MNFFDDPLVSYPGLTPSCLTRSPGGLDPTLVELPKNFQLAKIEDEENNYLTVPVIDVTILTSCKSYLERRRGNWPDEAPGNLANKCKGANASPDMGTIGVTH